MKKRIVGSIVAVILSSTLLFGCGSTSTPQQASSAAEEIHYADEDFINDLGTALEARWALVDTTDESNVAIGSDDDKKILTSYVQAELNVLADKNYENANFQDSKLKEKAISYLNCLKDQEEALQYITVDYEKYEGLWQPAYDKRTQLITEFASDYGLKVSEQYQSTLDDMVTNASIVQENEDKEAAINDLISGIEFEEAEEDYGWYTYEAIVENTMDYDIVNISLDVNLIDEDGVNIETQYCYLDNVAKGEKGKIEFQTDKEFDKTKITLDYYELK